MSDAATSDATTPSSSGPTGHVNPAASRGGRRPRLDPTWRQALKSPLVLALAAALLVQLVAALLLGSGQGLAPAARSTLLLDFKPDQVTGIEIQSGTGGDGGTVTLARAGDGWVLPDLGDFPAGTSRVQQLLETLAGLPRPLPVATSADARKRFKVADDAFERRVTLRGQDGTIGTLIAGDSPGFRRLFARLDGDDAVYDLRLALFDLAADPDQWIDRGRLQLDRAKITRVQGPDWTLVNGEGGWALADQDRGEPNVGPKVGLNQDAVDDLLTSLSALGYSGVLGTEPKPEYGLDAPVATLEVTLAGGEPRTYRIGAIEAGDGGAATEGEEGAASARDYALSVSGDPYIYRLAAFEVEGVLDADRDGLLDRAAADEPPGDAGTAGDTGAAGEAGAEQPEH